MDHIEKRGWTKESTLVASPNTDYENWCNARGLNLNHPLRPKLLSFFKLGADLDFIWILCRILVHANVMQSCAIETKQRLADRNRRWRKELHGLLSEHPGGRLHLTEVAQEYTRSIISFTATMLRHKGLLDSDRIEFSVQEQRWIIQQTLEPFAKMKGFPEDWDAAIKESDYSGTSNLLAAVGATKITPEEANSLKEMFPTLWESIFLNKQTKRSDYVGSLFLLFVTEHLRGKTGKPCYKNAFYLMRSLQAKASRQIENPRRSAMTRVTKLKLRLKKQWPQWETDIRRLEQAVRASRSSYHELKR